MRISDWSSDVCSSDLIVAADRLLICADAIDAPDGAVRPGVGEIDLQVSDRTVLDPDDIEGLLIVAPADRTDKPLVVKADALAADRQHRSCNSHILDRKSTRLNSSHQCASRMPSFA